LLEKFNYIVIFEKNKYCIKSKNYCSNWLSLFKFKKLALRLVSLKVFQ